MTRLPFSAILLAALLSPTVAEGQEVETRLLVQAPNLPVGATVQVTVNGTTRGAVLGADRTASIVLPGASEGTANIRLEFRALGFQTRAWSNSVDLNGSGQLVYQLNADGTGTIGQWPAVTWDADSGVLDVVVNGSTRGSTSLRRGVEPNRSHQFVWKRGNTNVCEAVVALPLNARRKYVCNTASGRVDEQ